ncbi:MAG: hypothetical protein KAH44_01160 [Oricola sp.]|nr:hypothetical protein [Oricola sp.]
MGHYLNMPKKSKADNRTQRQKFADLAREVECDESEAAFNSALSKLAGPHATGKCVCPECGHVFQGNGWDGIDAHWRSKHENVMPYEEAWPLLKAGKYPSR